jgi:hypothetical protein
MEKNRVTLHRVLTAKPEKVFRAFAQAKYKPAGCHLTGSFVPFRLSILKLVDNTK